MQVWLTQIVIIKNIYSEKPLFSSLKQMRSTFSSLTTLVICWLPTVLISQNFMTVFQIQIQDCHQGTGTVPAQFEFYLPLLWYKTANRLYHNNWNQHLLEKRWSTCSSTRWTTLYHGFPTGLYDISLESLHLYFAITLRIPLVLRIQQSQNYFKLNSLNSTVYAAEYSLADSPLHLCVFKMSSFQNIAFLFTATKLQVQASGTSSV